MASLTVRQLDEKLKQQLRLRAAKNGRSVEDEVRTILRSAAADPDDVAPATDAPAAVRRATATATASSASSSMGGRAAPARSW